jgi:site-specific DNA-methyltransferase (adenine-specific)
VGEWKVSRVEHIGGATLYLADYQDVLVDIGQVDHVISDPPYEDELHQAIGRIRRNDGQKMIDTLGFEGVNATREDIAGAMCETSQGWVILFCLAEGVRAWRDALQSFGAKYDTCLSWIKPDSAPRFNGQGAARGFECAVTAWSGKGYRSWNGGGKRGVFTHPVNTDRQGEHPTEKPVPLMLDLVTLYSNAGQVVFDPFMGSGTTGIACLKRGRRFVGVERNLKWFDLACRRIEAAQRQADLFVQPTKAAPMQNAELFA